MIIIEKDRHERGDSPFFEAHKFYNNWLLNKDFNNESTNFISLGDWFHSSHPTPEEIDEEMRFLSNSKMKFFLLAGNHDWSGVLKQYSILSFRNLSNVEIICEPCVKTIEGKTFAFLPHYKNLKVMKELYTNLSEEFVNADYVCYHFEDETQHGIDISYLKGKRFGGHIHTQCKNYELPMPITSRYDERGLDNGIYNLTEDKIISVPKLIDYYDIEHGDEIPIGLAMFPMINIKNAPSKQLAQEKYKDNYIHEIYVVNKKKEKIVSCVDDKKISILDFFNNYIKDRNDLEDSTKLRLKNYIRGKE
jgi:hypothetical protein